MCLLQKVIKMNNVCDYVIPDFSHVVLILCHGGKLTDAEEELYRLIIIWEGGHSDFFFERKKIMVYYKCYRLQCLNIDALHF